MEHWKTIDGFPNYVVSNKGRIRRIKTGRVIQSSPTSRDYLQVSLYNGLTRTPRRVARLVATAFIPNPQNLPQVNHKDGQRYNNHDENLEWATQSENMKHAYATGLETPLRGIKHNMVKLTEPQVLQIRLRIAQGVPQRTIARETGVCQSLISQINTGRIWGHL